MPSFNVAVGRMRWEYMTVPIEADTAEQAEAKARAAYDAGDYDKGDRWDLGEVITQDESPDHYASPGFDAELHEEPDPEPDYDALGDHNHMMQLRLQETRGRR
jgi:hypothetical protein